MNIDSAVRKVACWLAILSQDTGSARVSRAVLGVSPKTFINKNLVLGETPRTARETRALPLLSLGV